MDMAARIGVTDESEEQVAGTPGGPAGFTQKTQAGSVGF
jgi:hypothetical protein